MRVWIVNKSRYILAELGEWTMLSSCRWSLNGASALALFVTSPALGQTVSAPPLPVSAASSVAAAYDAYHIQPIWFRSGVNETAVAQLTQILQRAPFDGFPEGPQLATQVQAAVAQARGGNSQDIAAPERLLSAAWVQYVQRIKRATD